MNNTERLTTESIRKTLLVLLLITRLAQGQEAMKTADRTILTGDPVLRGKLVPPPGRTLLLVGQDVKTIDDYLQQVGPAPAGFMIYTNITYGTGLSSGTDYGAGECNASHYTTDKKFDQIFRNVWPKPACLKRPNH